MLVARGAFYFTKKALKSPTQARLVVSLSWPFHMVPGCYVPARLPVGRPCLALAGALRLCSDWCGHHSTLRKQGTFNPSVHAVSDAHSSSKNRSFVCPIPPPRPLKGIGEKGQTEERFVLLAWLVPRQRKQYISEDDEARGRNGVLEPFFLHASTHFKSVTRPVTAEMAISTLA